MQNLTVDEINVLLEALDAWINQDRQAHMIIEMLNSPRVQQQLSSSQQLEMNEVVAKVRDRSKNRDKAGVKLKAKLYEMIEQIELMEAMG